MQRNLCCSFNDMDSRMHQIRLYIYTLHIVYIFLHLMSCLVFMNKNQPYTDTILLVWFYVRAMVIILRPSVKAHM